jgi:hypothetical protein
VVERNSLRAAARLTRHSPNRVPHWLASAGQHGASVSATLIRDLPLTQVQIDELGTFVKKSKLTASRKTPADVGALWVWRALALPSRLRVVSHLSHDRSEPEARAFLAKFKARTDGRAPFFTSDPPPAYVAALIANSSTPEPPPVRRGPGRPRKEPRRLVDPNLRSAQVQKRREGGRVVEVKRQVLFGTEDDLIRILERGGCGSEINTAYVERDNLTSRQSNGRLVRKTVSHSQRKDSLRDHINFEDAVYNLVRPHSALRLRLRRPAAHGRLWTPRTPARAAGLTDHIMELGRASELVFTTKRLKLPFTAYGYSTGNRALQNP